MFNATFRALLCLGLLLQMTGVLNAQSGEGLLVLDAGEPRQVITAYAQDQVINFQHLKKGKVYMLVVPPDAALGDCLPDVSVVAPTAELLDNDTMKHLLRFKATSSIGQVLLHYPCSWEQSNPPRHYISIVCQDCTVKGEADSPPPVLSTIEVEAAGAEELIREVFIGGDCFDVTNVSYNGGGDQIGKFLSGLTNIGFETGMIMATGDINVAIGPNNSNGAGGGGSGGGDGDLASISSGALFDVAAIEFDFTPTQTPLTFSYAFASEEYCEYVNTNFNDVFGFFISGPGIAGTQNLAVIPMTNTPITINTINHVTNAGLYVHNTPAGLDNCENGGVSGTLPPVPPATGQATVELQYDGFTRKMIAVAQVIPCSTYHIKLAIADVGDGVWDSAVFLKSGSFDGGGNASVDWIVNGDPDLDEVVEGCGTVQLLIDRVGSNPSLPLPVSFTVTGTAMSGADFTPIPFTIVIPAGQDQVLFPVNIINDMIPEGAETVIVTLSSPCSCLYPQEILTILDYHPMMPTPDTITVCGPTGVGTVGVIVEGGVEPYSYQWNIGGNESTLTAFVSTSTSYTVTITDACGRTKTAVARIIVTPTPSAQLVPPAPQLCPGEEATIPVNFNGIGPFELTYALNGNPQSPIENITDDPYTLVVNQVGLYQIIAVIDSLGCPGVGSGAVLVTASNLSLTGTVSNASCSTLTNGSINTTVVGGQGPYNYSWQGPSNIGNIPDPVNILPGTYNVTVVDGFGCMNVNTFVVQSPPPLAPTTTVQGVNCAYPNNGSIDLTVAGGNPAYTYLWSNGTTLQDPSNLGVGTYTVTVTDQTGCAKTTTATITGDFTAPTSVATANGVINCTTSAIPLDGTGSSVGTNFVYNWLASPGNIVSGNGTLTPIVNQTGNYILKVTNTLNGCTATVTVPVVADNTPPATNAGPDGTLTCVVDTIVLNGNGSAFGSNYTHHWTASNGGIIVSGDSTLTPSVLTTGTYTLVVTNTLNGCTASDNAVVINNMVPPLAVVAPGGQITCVVTSVQLNGTGSSTGPNFIYDWTPPPGGGISSGGNTLTPTVNSVGTYTLVVTNTINGCTRSASATVTINANVPTAVAAPQGIITCAVPAVMVAATGSSSGPNIQYQWNTANGQILSGQGTMQISAGAVGTYTLLVTNTSNNCTSSYSIDVTSDVAPPQADAGSEVILTCILPAATLDGSNSSTGPNYTYQWGALSGGHFVSATNLQSPLVDEQGTYQITVTNILNGCTSTDLVLVLPDANDPVVQVAAPATLNCLISETTLNSIGSSVGTEIAYLWSGPGLVSDPAGLNAMVNQPGNYTLLISNTSNGCTSALTVAVAQDVATPPADAGPDKVLNCYNVQQQLGGAGNPVGSNFAFSWTGNGIVSGANTGNPVVNQSGLYTVVVTNTLNGCTRTDQVNITADFAPPLATAGPGFQLTCVQNTYTMQSTASVGPNFTYKWTSVGIGSFTTPTNILNPTVDGPGIYNLLVTNTVNGCTSTAQVTITQAADIPLAIVNNAPVLTCAIPSWTLSGVGSSLGNEFTYQWTASNGGNIVSGPNSLFPVINQPGTYKLLVFNTLNNCSSSNSLVVLQDITPPVIDAGAAPTLTCTATSLNLAGSVSSSGNFTYQWQAQNNGNIVGGGNTLSPTINAGGTYVLTVTSQANGCSSTDQVAVNVDQTAPVSAIQQPATLTCAAVQVTVNAAGSSLGNMVYAWSTVGGHFVNQTNPLQPIVDQPGTYTLLVTSNSNGCTASNTVVVPQDIQHPIASAGTDGLLTCAITTLQLSGNGSSQNGNFSYLWTTNDGQIMGGAGSLTPSIGAGGTYTLSVVNNVNGCSSSDNVLVNVNTQAPLVAIANPGLITCTIPQVTLNGSGSQGGPNIGYTWTTTDGNIVGGANSNAAQVSLSGHYTLTVLNNINGCSAVKTVTVTDNIVLPTAEAGPSFILTCTVDHVTLLGEGSTGTQYTYAWTTNGGHFISGMNSLQPVVNHAGTYALTVTNTSTGCTQTDNVIILTEINLPTDLVVDLVKPSCKDNDGSITFQTVTGGVGPYIYSINGGQNFTPALDFAQITPGTYDLWIQDANGCDYHEPLVVPQAPDPGISLDPSFTIELGDSLTILAVLPPGYPVALIDTITWTPLDGLTFKSTSMLDLLSPSAKPYKSTEYLVVLVSKDGCEARDKVLIRVDNEPHIYIPNAFSPWNEDGDNDVFLIFADNKQIDQVDKFQVYDRWGEMVFTASNFQPNDPAYGWTGRLRDKLMDPAVFVYYAEIRLIDGRVLLYKGDVTLVR